MFECSLNALSSEQEEYPMLCFCYCLHTAEEDFGVQEKVEERGTGFSHMHAIPVTSLI